MTDLIGMGKKARKASYEVASLGEDERNQALLHAADLLEQSADVVLKENASDLEKARADGMSFAMQDRLLLTRERIFDMAEGMRKVASLSDPLNRTLDCWTLPNGLEIEKRSVPIGCIGMIYEARPNVTSDAFSLCFKSGNTVILKGGSSALRSNRAITEILRRALSEEGINPDAVQFLDDPSHETADRFMRLNGYLDLLIPRGSKRLIQAVMENASVPVIETGAGNCHIYLDESADPEKAVPIVFNAKTQRIGVCNAAESLVVHRNALSILPQVLKKLQEKDVMSFLDPESLAFVESGADQAGLRRKLLLPASEEDFGTEYLDYKISVKTVGSLQEAIDHINRYSTHHSESIITENRENAEKFLSAVDSACVYVNASTRFTDGGQFGFGAEIGISTSRIHARGPMGLRELTSYKYLIRGKGQIRQ